VRPEAGNSVNAIRIDAAAAERATVERWGHDAVQDAFVHREVHRPLRG